MDYTIGSVDIGCKDLGIVYKCALIGDGDLHRSAVDGLCGLSSNCVFRVNSSGHNVVGQDGSKLCLVFWLEQVSNSSAELGESFVGRCENGERTSAAKSLNKAGSLYGRQQGLEFTRLGSNGRNVIGGWHHNRVDDVNDTVGASDVGGGNLCSVNRNGSTSNSDVNSLSIQSNCALDVDDVSSHDLALDHVVGQNRCQLGFVFWLEQISNCTCWQLCERFIGRCENGEWTRAFHRFNKAGGTESGR